MNKLLSIGFLSLALIGCGGEPTEDTSTVESTKTSIEDTSTAESNKTSLEDSLGLGITLGITPVQFGERVDPILSQLGINSGDWNKFNDEGEYFDSIIKDYPRDITLNATVDKNGELRSLQYMLPTIDASGAALTLSSLALTATNALNPELEDEKAQDVSMGALERVTGKFVETQESQREVNVVGSNAYVAEVSKLAITFRVDPAEVSEYVE